MRPCIRETFIEKIASKIILGKRWYVYSTNMTQTRSWSNFPSILKEFFDRFNDLHFHFHYPIFSSAESDILVLGKEKFISFRPSRAQPVRDAFRRLIVKYFFDFYILRDIVYKTKALRTLLAPMHYPQLKRIPSDSLLQLFVF